MNLLYSMNWLHPDYGGPYTSVWELACHVQQQNQEVSLLSTDSSFMPAQPPSDALKVQTVPCRFLPGIRTMWLPNGTSKIRQVFDQLQPELVHDNGLWLSLNHRVCQEAKQRNLPYVLSPRGCLDPWAMDYRSWKKQLALTLYQKRDLQRVDCFHAASELEAESIRAQGFHQPIAVIPNGVSWGSSSPTSQKPPSEKVAVFIGRLHPIKNLPSLFRAWALVRPEGWILKIAGSDEAGHRAELERLAVELGIAEQVRFLGPIYGEAKWELLQQASLAFLVSHSENFSLFVAEALGFGVPVIASRTTPWKCLEEQGLGAWVEGSPEGIAAAMQRRMSMSEQEVQTMVDAALVFARSAFTRSRIAEQFVSVYEWLLGEGDLPSCVLPAEGGARIS